MADTPSIPTIDSGQQGGVIPSVATILSQAGIGAAPTTIPSATITQTAPNPHLPVDRTPQQLPMQHPMGNTFGDKKRARVANTWTSVANAINQHSSRMMEKHIDNVKQSVTTVINAQQQVSNADSIINAPPGTYSSKDLQNAQAVRKNAAGIIDREFSDPKKQKSLKKAFDVSFTDPAKNDTPEIKAMIGARKEFEISKQSGLNVDNPAEKRVQDLANGTTGIDAAHASGLKVRGVDESRQPSGTSYADQFMKQVPQQLAQNPAFLQMQKQREESQKAALKVAPTIINATAAGERNAATNAQRAQAVKDNNDARMAQERLKTSEAMKRTQLAMGAAMKRTMANIHSRETIALNKATKPEDQSKILGGNLKVLSDLGGKLEKQISDLEATKAAAKSNKASDETIAEYDKFINEAKDHYRSNSTEIEITRTRLGELAKGGTNVDNSSATGTKRAAELTENTTDGSSIGSDEDTNSDDYDQ